MRVVPVPTGVSYYRHLGIAIFLAWFLVMRPLLVFFLLQFSVYSVYGDKAEEGELVR